MSAPYVRLNTAALQAGLLRRAEASGVNLVDLRADDASPAPDAVIVNATGREPSDGLTRYQTAYGMWVELSTSWLAEGEMIFMDLRPQGVSGPPSFLYAMREGALHFVQETVLVSSAIVPMGLLEERLMTRLTKMGLAARTRVAEERCVIPMGGPPRCGRLNEVLFGAKAGMTQPASGYQLARTLTLSSRVARALSVRPEDATCRAARARSVIWPRAERAKWSLFNYGAEVMAKMGEAELGSFLELFHEQPESDLISFIDGRLSLPRVLRQMAGVFRKADWGLRAHLLSLQSFRSNPNLKFGKEIS